jgi:hypothetical protein
MFFLSEKSSKRRLKEAERARKNRLEILKAWSQGQISRRDLLKWGLFTTGGVLVAKQGLSPFVRSAYADSIPTGLPSSPLFGVQDFSTPMPRFDVLARNPNPFTFLSPSPTAQANLTQQPLNPALEGVSPGDTGPIEGRPGGPIWAHQGFTTNPPKIAVTATQEGAKTNTVYNPQVASQFNSHQPGDAYTGEVSPGPADQNLNSV